MTIGGKRASDLAAFTARRLREERAARGITCESLAARCGMTQPGISRLESGSLTPTLATIARVAWGIGVALDVRLV